MIFSLRPLSTKDIEEELISHGEAPREGWCCGRKPQGLARPRGHHQGQKGAQGVRRERTS